MVDENVTPEVATEVTEEEAAEVAAAVEEAAEAVAVAEAETGDAPESPSDEEPAASESDEGQSEETEEEAPRTPQAQPGFVPSMTDEVQGRMNAGIAQGNASRRATIKRNQQRKAQQHASIANTNRPGPSE
jgi:hypothetical protein